MQKVYYGFSRADISHIFRVEFKQKIRRLVRQPAHINRRTKNTIHQSFPIRIQAKATDLVYVINKSIIV